MVEVRNRFEHPRLAAAIGDVTKTGEEIVADFGVGREGPPHECTPRPPTRILDTAELLGENGVPTRDGPNGQFFCELDVVRFAKGQARYCFRLAPDVLQPEKRGRRSCRVAQSREPRSLCRRCRCPTQPFAKDPLEK